MKLSVKFLIAGILALIAMLIPFEGGRIALFVLAVIVTIISTGINFAGMSEEGFDYFNDELFIFSGATVIIILLTFLTGLPVFSFSLVGFIVYSGIFLLFLLGPMFALLTMIEKGDYPDELEEAIYECINIRVKLPSKERTEKPDPTGDA